ncbi:unnamed protein product [Musa acuminata subsp. malaccensis]|uniref:(wild Malaysian banana) hypothetical protein n=1 Tax=Musa acuminata subsp. malaccensis TaxID=214687 RepID=A0A804IN67_MUSAM|nr:unnamed protein product [Musa acuminata subsp. malaccensis]
MYTSVSAHRRCCVVLDIFFLVIRYILRFQTVCVHSIHFFVWLFV